MPEAEARPPPCPGWSHSWRPASVPRESPLPVPGIAAFLLLALCDPVGAQVIICYERVVPETGRSLAVSPFWPFEVVAGPAGPIPSAHSPEQLLGARAICASSHGADR